MHGGGTASRDWLLRRGHAEAIAAVIAAPLDRIAGEVINVATGVDVDVQASPSASSTASASRAR